MNIPTDIIDCVCQQLQVNRRLVMSKSRQRHLVEARMIAIGLILINNHYISLTKLGEMFNRDHSTIIYSREVFNDIYGRDKQFTKKVNLIKQLTNNLN